MFKEIRRLFGQLEVLGHVKETTKDKPGDYQTAC